MRICVRDVVVEKPRIAAAAACLSILAVPAGAQVSDRAQAAAPVHEIPEIVVTAQRREENLEDVPISMTVLGGPDLDRSTFQGVTEALNTVPGVAATENYLGGGTLLTVRGVSASGPTFDGSNPIAYYLDGVPFGFVRTAFAPDANAFDLARVEVLRGPQGTLYGANALNGVVRVLTNEADLDAFDFNARAVLSSTHGGGENYRADAALNVPLVPGALAVRAVAGYADLSGWIDRATGKDANDAELRTLRLRIDAQPTDSITLGLSAWSSRADHGAPSTSADGATNGSLFDEPLSTDYDAFGARLGFDFSGVSFTSMTSYLDYHNRSDLDFTGVGLPLIVDSRLDSEVFSQELTLQSTGDGPWRWSLGALYRDDEDRTVQSLPALGPLVVVDFVDRSRSLALFGELTRILADGGLELTAGLRYFEDEVETVDELPTGIAGEADFDALTPRFVVNWHPSDHLTVYASYAQGFRSGVLQTPNIIAGAPTIPPADADELSNYELGAKGRWLDGRVSFDSALYYIDWQDVQQTLTVDIGGIGFNALVNGESASGIGVDLALGFEAAEGLQLGFAVSWNDLAMDSAVTSGGILLFEEGDRLNRSPELTASVSAGYAFPIAGRFEGEFAISGNYIDEQTTRSILGGVRVLGISDETLTGRASLSVAAPGDWRVALFVDNFTDEDGTPLSPPFGVDDWNARLRPRTVGIQFELGF